jgi:hypothetical protein
MYVPCVLMNEGAKCASVSPSMKKYLSSLSMMSACRKIRVILQVEETHAGNLPNKYVEEIYISPLRLQ